MSVTRMSARRSAEALAPISSHLRSRSPPQASPIIEKRRASTRTPSVRKEASVASERKRSHIYNDDYETSETVRKRPNTSIPASAKKRSAAKPRPKQSSAAKEAKATPTRTRKSVPKLPRSAAVGLDEIEADRAYGKDSIDSEDIDEEESPVEKTVHKVVSRAAYEKSLKEPSPSKTLDSAQKSAKKEVDGVDGMDIEKEHPALIDDSITPHYVTTDSYNIGSEDESHMDSDYPGDNIPCRDEDGADADVEDEDEEDEDDEEDDAVPAPYDSGVLTEMETEYVEEEVGEVEELEDEDEDGGEVEGEGDEGEVKEDGDEGEGEVDEVEEEDVEDEDDEEEEEENRENVDDHDKLSEKEVLGDVVEIDDDAISSDYLSELEADAEEDDGDDYANATTTFRAQIADDDEVVDLVSSDEEVLEEEEEEEEEDDAVEADEDSECDSFLTADSNDPNFLYTAAADTDSLALVPVVPKNEVTKQDTVADAVNTVLSAFKNSLSAKDFEQLQLIMSKEVKISETTVHDKSEIVAAQEQESEMLVDEPDERTGSRKRIEAVSRLSGDGTSWASRESFQPTSPYDRFSSTMSSILSLPSASNGVSGEKVDPSADNTLSHLTRWNSTVRFEDKTNEFRERSSLSSGSSSHIKYGPVTFMRRPMTPFARKMAASPSPLGSSYSNHPADPMSSSRGVGQFSGFKSRPQYMDADVPFPSSDGLLRKRGHEESMSYSDRDQGGSKRLNLGQSAYSVRSAEQSRRSLTAPDSRFSDQESRFIQNGGQEGQSFAHGSVAQGPRVSSSVYTPMYTDNKYRGTFTGVLLQPSQQQSQSQSQARRASFSFSQRRKLTRKSEGSIFSNSNNSSLAAPVSSTSSAYASASVAKKILDTLSELQTPIEEARHRPIAVNSAIRASTEAIARSERLAAEPAPKSTGNATLKADPSPGSFSWAFPSVPSVGLAAVAAATAAATATTTATATATTPSSSTLSFSFPVSKSASIATETARSTNKIPAITTTAPAHLTPSFSHSTSILKTPRTPNNVRFAAQDSEFTFGDPSEVEGVDSTEIERVLSTPGSKRNEKIRFAFSPPGKAMMSSEKGRRKATPQEEVTKETPKPLATTPAVILATSSGESLWTKAASAAQDYQKCAVCFVQNSNTATKCLSCESSLKGAGQGAAAVVAPKSAPAAGESLWTKAASAAQDFQKCAVCFVQNSNTATKCLSCESSLKGSGQAVTAAAAPVQSAPVTIPAFSFGSAPVASKTATVTAEVPIPTSTPWGTAPPSGPTKDFSGSFSMQPSSAQTAVSTATPLPGGFSFGAPAAASSTGGATGFSITPPATTGFTFGGTSSVPAAVPASAVSAAAAAAPSLVMPPASASFGGFFTGPAAVPPLASNPFSASSSTVSAPSSSAATTTFPATLPASTTKKETVGFQFGAPTSATPSVTPPAPAAPASAATFKGFSSITSATVTGASDKPQISFGESIATRPNASLPPTTTSPAPFSFGSLPSTTPTTTTIAPFSFGKSETVSAPTSSTPTPAPFMFGSVPAVKPVESAPSFTASPSPFQFGSMNPTPVPAYSATPAFSFDSSSAPAPFRFGTSASTVASTPALASPFPSIVSAQGTSTAFGVDSPNSTMDTGYMSGDASNIGFPPALSSTSFGSASAPFSFGAPAMSSGAMGSQLPPFGTSSQPFGGGSAPFAASNSSQPFTFGALPQPQSQPQSQSQFGYAPGIAGASGMFAQPLAAAPSPAFSFDTSRGGGMAPQGMQSMGPSGGGGGFSMGASDNGNRKKVRAKRPGGQ